MNLRRMWLVLALSACSTSAEPVAEHPRSPLQDEGPEPPTVRLEPVEEAPVEDAPVEDAAGAHVDVTTVVRPTNICTLPPVERASGVRMRLGDVYVNRGRQALRYDLALPSGTGPFPLVVLIHGGGWRAGERAHLREEIGMLAGLGYAAVSLDYRLVPRGVFPGAVADVRCAVRHLRQNAAQLSLDPDRIVVGGFSAGAYLASLVALAPDETDLDEACDAQGSLDVAGLLAFFPPVDLRSDAGWNDATRGVIGRFLGVLPADDPNLAVRASPIDYIAAGGPPTLVIHGTADETVPVDQSHRFVERLRTAGIPTSYVEIEGAGHGFPLFSPRPSLRAAPCTTLAWLAAITSR